LNPSPNDNLLTFESIDFFHHLGPSQREKIKAIALIRRFEAGKILFYEGDQSDYFHFLIEGEVSVFKTTAAQDSLLIHRFHAPSLIAEAATLKQIPYPASCEAHRSSLVVKIMREPFLELLQNDPSLSIALIASLSQKISALERSFQRQSAPNALAKVARLIRDEPETFEKLKGIETASLLGITPETLSRMVKKLKTENIIALLQNRVRVIDPEKLSMICG
jgi:CRP-like cAMP-binding protein